MYSLLSLSSSITDMSTNLFFFSNIAMLLHRSTIVLIFRKFDTGTGLKSGPSQSSVVAPFINVRFLMPQANFDPFQLLSTIHITKASIFVTVRA